MKNLSEVEIGQKYKHSSHPGTVYLGCGRKSYLGAPEGKILVIIEATYGTFVGHIVQFTQNRSFIKGFSKIRKA